jgi:lipopolysaccharide heptosyltransferase II
MSGSGGFLIINPFGIGDVLFTTPVIESIKEGGRDRKIGYLCNRRTEPLLRANPNVSRVFVYEKDELRQLWKASKLKFISEMLSFISGIRRENFGTAIDLSLNREYGFMCILAGIKTRIGFNYRNRGIYLTKKIDIEGYSGKHIIEHYLKLLELAGIEPSGKDVRLYIPDADMKWARDFLMLNNIPEDRILVGLAPAGGASWGKDARVKHWRIDGFAEVADRIADSFGARIMLFGSPTEAKACETMASVMRNSPINVCGKTSLMQAAALLSRCRLVIANDGGLLHLAAAAGAGTVGIFGPVDEKVYGQYPGGPAHRTVREEVSCRPCYVNFRMKDCPDRICLSRIEPDRVFREASEVISLK